MLAKKNWGEPQERFKAWWRREGMDRPLMYVVAKRKESIGSHIPVEPASSPEEFHLGVERRVAQLRAYCNSHVFLGESFPYLDLNIGPGSLAVYLGSDPIFAWDTVWYKECIEDWNSWGQMRYNRNNEWWLKHQGLLGQAKQLAGEDFLVSIPDIVENVDILSAMRGPQTFCFDLIDNPQMMEKYIEQIDNLYFEYYDRLYDIVKLPDGSSCYTAFHIWGPGKTAKIQCDFCALMSPNQFRQFVQHSLEKQCQQLDNSLYHLDGPDAIKHLDALMEIDELDALQWTAGAGQPDGGNKKWYPIYDQVRDAGKGLWTSLSDGDFDDWVASADRLVKRYGSEGLFLLFPEMEEEQAERLMVKAERDWR